MQPCSQSATDALSQGSPWVMFWHFRSWVSMLQTVSSPVCSCSRQKKIADTFWITFTYLWGSRIFVSGNIYFHNIIIINEKFHYFSTDYKYFWKLFYYWGYIVIRFKPLLFFWSMHVCTHKTLIINWHFVSVLFILRNTDLKSRHIH